MTKEKMEITALLDEIAYLDCDYIGCVDGYYITCKHRVGDALFNFFGANDRGLPIFKQSKAMYEKLLKREPAYHQELGLVIKNITRVIEILES